MAPAGMGGNIKPRMAQAAAPGCFREERGKERAVLLRARLPTRRALAPGDAWSSWSGFALHLGWDGWPGWAIQVGFEEQQG